MRQRKALRQRALEAEGKRPSADGHANASKQQPAASGPLNKEQVAKALEKFHPKQFSKGIETRWLKKESSRSHEWGFSQAAKRKTLQRWISPGETDLRRYKDQWIKDHATSLKILGRYYRMPAEFLAAVAWQEVGGDPDANDRLKVWVLTLPGVRTVGELAHKRPEKISYGDTSIHLGHIAEMMGIKNRPIESKELRLIAHAMEDEQIALGLSAAHIGEALDQRYPNRRATRFSPEMAAFLGLGYNAGYDKIMKLQHSQFRPYAESLKESSRADIDVPNKYSPMRHLLYDHGKP